MFRIVRKRTGNISIPFELKKSSIFYRIADITDTDLLFPGSIIVSPKLLPPDETKQINWTLTNLTKNIKIEDGVGEKTFLNLEPGLYSLEYKPIQGYITPIISVKNLEERQTILFDSIYEEGISGIGNDTGTINVFMNLILGGWKIQLLDDNNNVLFSIPENGYSRLLEYSQSGLPLGKYRIVIQELNTPITSPTESDRIQYLTLENGIIDWTITYDNPTQFKATLTVNVDNPQVKWEVDAKYRENDPISGIGEVQQLPIFVSQQGEPWKLKIKDSEKQFEKYIIRAKYFYINEAFNDVLYRNNETNEYYYGYDDDKLLFNVDSGNTIHINVKNTVNVIIPKIRFSFEGKNYLNQYGYGKFMNIFNPSKNNNPFYASVEQTVERFWHPEDTVTAQSKVIFSETLNPEVFPLYMPNPREISNYFNIGFFRFKVNVNSTITLFYLELDNQGNPKKLTTIYSARGTQTPILVIDVENNIVPVIDISA